MRIQTFFCCIFLFSCQGPVPEKSESIQVPLDDQNQPTSALPSEPINKDTVITSSNTNWMKLEKQILPPKQKINDLTEEDLLGVYQNIEKSMKLYHDSSLASRKYLIELLEKIEAREQVIEGEKLIAIELKLNIASIKSKLHLLRSQLKYKS